MNAAQVSASGAAGVRSGHVLPGEPDPEAGGVQGKARTSHRQARGARDRAEAHAGPLRQRDSSSRVPDSDGEDDVVIIYNRVPKTASTSFTNIAYDLCGKNRYHVLHINTTKNNPVMSIQDQTFDECVSAGGSDCAPEKLWLQIPFFCGHYSECWNAGSQWALEQAKYNLVNEYLLVGVTEELEDFVMMLEAALPRFFRGATELYRTGKKSHLRKTSEKKPPTKESIAKLQQSAIWKMENEFYEFALEQFQFVRAHAVREKDGELYLLAQNFFYEKIYPKN
ncbi:unnamed protein product [Tetraodon nigroviridis]|uniref:Heparan sulfate 2-O-sulfotransferase 1 n=2 Tax=Percomorphaceae TaxID=1489872 RepID=Q4SSL7_TETNG|nr:unnamed protein product [Tetraodon nigroviridis]